MSIVIPVIGEIKTLQFLYEFYSTEKGFIEKKLCYRYFSWLIWTMLKMIHVCVCPKLGPCFPMSYFIVFFFMFNELWWKVIVRFVDFGGIVDDHCLNFLFIIKGWPRWENCHSVVTRIMFNIFLHVPPLGICIWFI